MNIRTLPLALLTVALLAVPPRSEAQNPVSSCALRPQGTLGFVCNVYESTANGAASDISDIFVLPQRVISGYLVLLEGPGVDQTDVHFWSDVLHFIDNGQNVGTTAQLLSDGCNNPLDFFSCFPTYAQVTAVSHTFLVQTQTGTGDDYVDFTTYNTGTNIYNIFSGAPVLETDVTPTPEPASLVLIGSGLLGIGAFSRRKRDA